MRMKKLLILILSGLMVATMVPATAFGAVEGDVIHEEGGELYMDKKSQLQDDGTYAIEMEAYSTAELSLLEQETSCPLDIVMVIDQSASLHTTASLTGQSNRTLLDDMHTAVRSFTNAVYEDGKAKNLEHRIAIAGFASGANETANGNQDSYVGKTDKGWINTGIFLKDGTFKNYMGNESGAPGYKTVNGAMVPGKSYYYKDSNGKYIPLVLKKGAYVKAVQPVATDAEVYTNVNGEFLPAEHRVVKETVQQFKEVPYPAANDNVTYYIGEGENKTQVKWKNEIYVPAESVNANTNYWVNDDGWNEITYEFTNNEHTWSRPGKTPILGRDTTYTYRVIQQPNQIEREKHKLLGFIEIIPAKLCTAYDKFNNVLTLENPDRVIAKTEKIYVKEQVQKDVDKWFYNNQEVTDLYIYDANGDGWFYSDNGVMKQVDPNNVYEKDRGTSGLNDTDFRDALMNVSESPDGQGNIQSVITKSIDRLASGGATRTGIGIEMGNEIFANNPIDRTNPKNKYRKRVMIVFTDGEPSYSSYDPAEAGRAVNEAYKTKHTHNAEVYTVGIGLKLQREKDLLDHISSNYPDASYSVGNAVAPNTIKSSNNTDYVIKNGNDYVGVDVEYGGWGGRPSQYTASLCRDGYNVETINPRPVSPRYAEKPNNNEYHFYPVIKNIGLPTSQAVYFTTNDKISIFDASLFKTILARTSVVKSPVYVEGTSIFRDIMTEDFKVTDKTKVYVYYIPGELKQTAQPTDPVNESNIVWGKEKEQIVLDRSKGETKVVGQDQVTVKIEYQAPGTNPEYKNNDIVDVSGFNYGEYYIGFGHPGKKIKVRITGLEAQPTVNTDGDTPVSTNHPDSGLWVPDKDGNIKKPTKPFPEQPIVTTSVTEGVFVQDYAKSMDIPINGLSLLNVSHIQAMKNINDNYKAFDTPVLSADNNYGSMSSDGTKLTYKPKKMSWDGYDNFFVFGKNNKASPDKPDISPNVWSKVSVIPANNVYYEDTFVTEEGTTEGTVGITYTGNWTAEGTENNGAAPKPAGDNGQHGWIPVLGNEVADTDGTVHHGVVENTLGSMATANFSFTGDGVDIYSRTSPETGTILASLASEDGTIFVGQLIDTVSASGTYYQVPTLSFKKQNDGSPLPYGKYNVTIYVTAAAEGRYNYYLDGIRVYNPLNDKDATVDNAYGESESNAIFTDVREHIVDSNSFNYTRSSMGVFIDQFLDKFGKPIAGKHETTIVREDIGPGSFEKYGPKNEIYLKPGQQISFKVDINSGNTYQIGLKAIDGKAVNVLYNENQAAESVIVNHPGDLYYNIVPDSNGIIHIINDPEKSTGTLSVTKLKVTNATPMEAGSTVFINENNENLMKSARSFRMMALPPPPEESKPVKPEVKEPVTEDIKTEEPEVKQPEAEKTEEIKPESTGNVTEEIKHDSAETEVKEPVIDKTTDTKPEKSEQKDDKGIVEDKKQVEEKSTMVKAEDISIKNPEPVKKEQSQKAKEKKNITTILDDIFGGFRSWF